MIAYIFDGSKATLQSRGKFSVQSKTTIGKSIKDAINSEVTLLGEGIFTLDNFDLIRLESTQYTLWGFITDIVLDKTTQDVATCQLHLDTDGMTGENVFINGTQEHFGTDIEAMHGTIFYGTAPHYFAPANQVTRFSGYWTAPGFKLDFAQAIRQLFRQGIKLDRTVTGDDKLLYTPYRHHNQNENQFEINFDGVLDYSISYTKDNLTSIRCYQKVNDSYYYLTVAFLNDDGTVTYYNPTDSVVSKPIKTKVMIFEKNSQESNDAFTARVGHEAKNELLTQSYNNSSEIVVDIDTWIYRDIFFSDKEDMFFTLGDSGMLTLPNGNQIKTIVSEISLEDNVATIRFGLGSTRLFEILRRRNQNGM